MSVTNPPKETPKEQKPQSNLSTTTTASSGVLTLENLDKMIAYFDSDEYYAAETERMHRQAASEIMLAKALSKKLITEGEYYYCLGHIQNGYIIMGSTMYKRLKPKLKQLDEGNSLIESKPLPTTDTANPPSTSTPQSNKEDKT